MGSIEFARIEAQKLYASEYEKALRWLKRKHPNGNPKKIRDAARRIAKKKVRNYLRSLNLTELDLHPPAREFTLEDLL